MKRAPEIGVVYLWMNPLNSHPDKMTVAWQMYKDFVATLRVP